MPVIYFLFIAGYFKNALAFLPRRARYASTIFL